MNPKILKVLALFLISAVSWPLGLTAMVYLRDNLFKTEVTTSTFFTPVLFYIGLAIASLVPSYYGRKFGFNKIKVYFISFLFWALFIPLVIILRLMIP